MTATNKTNHIAVMGTILGCTFTTIITTIIVTTINATTTIATNAAIMLMTSNHASMANEVIAIAIMITSIGTITKK